ncbi:hypothetical protein A5765_08195 [Mycolicibacterium celeriflavum]|uniref:DUF3303 domain-containing protein n=1 Tax=Mycolicibacterium celeriflavum TaxID=1249101 RepID=UPI000801B598|nr:DUF3303 family protein [Mycolicibacterium celeriflavum]OBG15885.1 hypothetical protein A5765_08195 [Mycolicibacterium celeriflavum]
MKYLVQWHLSEPSVVRAAAKRFLETGGKPPEGASIVGRWFGTNGKGCVVVEASDAKQVLELVTEWSEFMQIEATPALEDHEAGEVLGKLFG